MACDVAMSGHTYIIFMLRKLSVLQSDSPRPVLSDADVPDCPLAVDASRNLLAIVHGLLVQNPSPETMCLLFGIYRLYVALACLLNSILRAPDVRGRLDDVALVERLADVMVLAMRGEKDFVPLIRALQSRGVEVKRKVSEASGATRACLSYVGQYWSERRCVFLSVGHLVSGVPKHGLFRPTIWGCININMFEPENW